ncbi:MAG: hypothetical protein ACPGRD_01815 [Planktomarina sp.]
MTKFEGTSLNPVADALVINAIRGLLANDFRQATDASDLAKRLHNKGYDVSVGFLATYPQGKMICPIAAL